MKFWRFATASEHTAIVFAPDLDFWLDLDLTAWPVLERLLRSAVAESYQGDGYAGQWMLGQPVAPAPLWRALDDELSSDRWVMNVSLVSLRADLNAVWASEWAQPIDDALLAVLTELFDGTMGTLARGLDGTLYALLEQVPKAEFAPIWALAGQSLDALMPEGEEAKPWVQLISESQILLHQYKRSSAQAGAFPDGVWIWGVGCLPVRDGLKARVHSVVAQAREVQGLAQWMGLVCHRPVPGQVAAIEAGQWIEFVPSGPASAEGYLDELNHQLRPVLRRIYLGRLRRVELVSRHHRWVVTTQGLWRSLMGRS